MLVLQKNILNHFFLGKLPESTTAQPQTYRQFYQSFLQAYPDAKTHGHADAFLQQQLSWADSQRNDLPENPEDLPQWLQQHIERTGYAYQQYLKSRKQGAPRRFFANKSEAYIFLQHVEPTKRVDGAWLYGTLNAWHDASYTMPMNTPDTTIITSDMTPTECSCLSNSPNPPPMPPRPSNA